MNRMEREILQELSDRYAGEKGHLGVLARRARLIFDERQKRHDEKREKASRRLEAERQRRLRNHQIAKNVLLGGTPVASAAVEYQLSTATVRSVVAREMSRLGCGHRKLRRLLAIASEHECKTLDDIKVALSLNPEPSAPARLDRAPPPEPASRSPKRVAMNLVAKVATNGK